MSIPRAALAVLSFVLPLGESLAAPTVLTFEGAPVGPTTGLEYVAQGVVLSSSAGTQEFDYRGAITSVATSGDWHAPLELRFVVPGAAEDDAVTTFIALTNRFGPGGPGVETDHWTATSYDLAGNAIETQTLLGDGVLTFQSGSIHRLVVDDLNETAFAIDDLTFDPPTACGDAYGSGCPGTGGFVPTLFATGCGGSTLSLTIAFGLGGASAFLFPGTAAAALPMGGGCSLLVVPATGPMGPLPLGGSGAGKGTTTLTLPTPVVTSTITARVQAFVVDTGNGMPFSNSNALALTFTP